MEGAAKLSSCECWFLDVGQGTSNVILLGDGRAIVIDCGPSGSVQTLRLLKQWADTIEALIISHNDSDHDGSVQRILSSFRKSTKRIFFLADRTPQEINLVRTIGRLKSDLQSDFPRPERLEADGSEPKVLFAEGDTRLSVMYPDLMENLAAQAATPRAANRTSGILRLECGKRKIVFSGDATIDAWNSLASKINGPKPLQCDIMTVPHHGGAICADSSREGRSQEKLYSEILNPKFGIVSVGTANHYKHPLPKCISSLSKFNGQVLCTQMTSRCCENLESVRGLRRMMPPSRSTPDESRTQGGRSRHVACFGSIVAEISPAAVRISNLTRYRQSVEDFRGVAGFDPLCSPTQDKTQDQT
jgi:competence protein ComEC